MKQAVSTDEAFAAPHILSQAVVSGSTIYVSGQVHCTPDGALVEGTTEQKVAQIMQNIAAVLKAVDAELNDIVKVTIYVTDMAQMPELNEVYPTYFDQPYPAREAVCVAALPLGATIEISVVAEK
jgi:2-iminobutanoate/2-iminopropanoate deaminase